MFGIDREANKFADPRRQIMLYRHAQPAPVVTFYRDGIEAAAKWIDQQREAYDSEHGWSDPGTGSFEFGNDAQREYSSTLEELAEGIRSLHPNAGNSPVIPDGSASMLRRWLVFGRGMQNAGSQLPHNLIAETEEMLAAADCSIPMISDRWVPVSERMPDDDDFVYIWPRPDFGVELHVGQYCECSPKGDGWYAQVYEQNYGIEWYPITVTHWMPLPASPQEVNHG
ncbi:DUF551 domain-containing protein [Klebsiella oxytoca]|uniref:DUF551 domain-containing protein n=1 Tax=Klebsiella oxytoca TaxID=571 RepID=UPI0020C2D7F8|nr:DUF551 domain-containing protein [Klebsiella oxytoca]